MNFRASSPTSAVLGSPSAWRASAVAIADQVCTDDARPGVSSISVAPAASSAATVALNARRTSSSTGAKPRSSDTATRSSRGSGTAASSPFASTLWRSRACMPTIASSIARESATVWAIGP
jgi:hypothetical protein